MIDQDGKKISRHSQLKEDMLIEMAKLSGEGSIYVNSNSFLSLKKMFSMLDDYDSDSEKTIFKREDKSISIELSLCSLILFCIGVIICYEVKVV